MLWAKLKLSSANAFNLDKAEILSSDASYQVKQSIAHEWGLRIDLWNSLTVSPIIATFKDPLEKEFWKTMFQPY